MLTSSFGFDNFLLNSKVMKSDRFGTGTERKSWGSDIHQHPGPEKGILELAMLHPLVCLQLLFRGYLVVKLITMEAVWLKGETVLNNTEEAILGANEKGMLESANQAKERDSSAEQVLPFRYKVKGSICPSWIEKMFRKCKKCKEIQRKIYLRNTNTKSTTAVVLLVLKILWGNADSAFDISRNSCL